jgi:transposase
MARRNIPMVEIQEVLYRWIKGRSEREIARLVGTSRNTIHRIVKKAIDNGLKREANDKELERVSLILVEQKNTAQKGCGPAQVHLSKYHEQINAWRLMPHMTVTQMVRLLGEQGQKIGETSLRRYLRRHFPSLPNTTVHLESLPGKQSQVDFGAAGLMKDPRDGKLHKSHAFIMTLSYSRYRFVRFVFRQDINTWIDCHIRAFQFFGGVPSTIMIDNLKAGIISADFYDPTLNRTYGELEKHYGFVVDPTKVRTPQHKGKVERSVTIIRQQILAGREFKDIEDANRRALHWCRFEIAQRVTRTTGKTPWEMFSSKEQSCLNPLPAEEFTIPTWQSGKIHRDHHVVFEGSFYSVPSKYIEETVWIRATQRMVEIFLSEQRIKTHIRATSKGQWITDQQDYPKSARMFLEKDASHCLAEAGTIGVSTHSFISQVLTRPTITSQRKAQSILRLAENYGTQRLEAACQRALLFDNTAYKSLKLILINNLDRKEEEHTRVVEDLEGSSYLRSAREFIAEYLL